MAHVRRCEGCKFINIYISQVTFIVWKKSSYINPKLANFHSQLFAEGVIGFGAHRFAQLASAHTKVYKYKFSYAGRYSHTYYPADKPYGKLDSFTKIQFNFSWISVRNFIFNFKFHRGCSSRWFTLSLPSSGYASNVQPNRSRKCHRWKHDWMVDEFCCNWVRKMWIWWEIIWFRSRWDASFLFLFGKDMWKRDFEDILHMIESWWFFSKTFHSFWNLKPTNSISNNYLCFVQKSKRRWLHTNSCVATIECSTAAVLEHRWETGDET